MTATREQRRRKREREKAAKAELRAPALAAAEVERKRLAARRLWDSLYRLPGLRSPDATPYCAHGYHERHHAPHGLLDQRRAWEAEQARHEARNEASRQRMGGRLGMLMLAAVMGGGQ